MVQVTEDALEKLREMLSTEGGDQSAVRIAVMGGGTQRPSLGLVVDEAGVGDKRYDVDGVPVIVDRSLIEYCRSVTIDFTVGAGGTCGGSSGSGFIIAPENPLNL